MRSKRLWWSAAALGIALAQAQTPSIPQAETSDVATLKPLDRETILKSVARTGRLVVVHEAPLTGGFGGEIAACVAGAGLMHLVAPIERVTGFDTVMPYPRTEAWYIPSVDRVLAAARRAMEFQ